MFAFCMTGATASNTILGADVREISGGADADVIAAQVYYLVALGSAATSVILTSSPLQGTSALLAGTVAATGLVAAAGLYTIRYLGNNVEVD
jgi:hypothetical protein